MMRAVFLPSSKRGEVPEGVTVLDAARRLGVDLDSVCGGRGICGRCQVDVAEGVFPKFGLTSSRIHLSPSTAVEERYAEKRGPLQEGRRLGCQARLMADAIINVPEESQLHRQIIRKELDERPIALDPAVRLYLVDVAEPCMEQPVSDFRRLKEALHRQWNLASVTASLAVLAALPGALRKSGGRVTVAIGEEHALIGVWPGFVGEIYGLAIDVGSTTIAMHLCALSSGRVLASAGTMNPQIRFGEDLMSRVSHAMMEEGGAAAMTMAVRQALSELVVRVTEDAAISQDHLTEAVIVGNPVMHHLLLGLDPTALGTAPFTPVSDEACHIPFHSLGLPGAPGAMAYFLPLIAGHVGADTAAVILAEAPQEREEVSLLVDIGTNAEIVLGNRERLLACSSPTGPAFEGAQISSGQRAAPGVIERVRIDRSTLMPRFKIIGCESWSDHPDFAEASKATGITGICGSGVIEAIAELYLAGVIRPDGVIDGALRERSACIQPEGRTFRYVLHASGPVIAITQADVRAIQLAKAALGAGVHLLLDHYGPATINRIALAGAFGSHIDPLYAMVLGLLPDCEPEKVVALGNAAGTGARLALLSRAARRSIEETVRKIEKVETALEPDFQRHFVDALTFPHARDPYPHLGAILGLPERVGSESRRRQRRRAASSEAE